MRVSEIIHTGKILASEPRAVRVRMPEDQSSAHSAVHGSIDILTNSTLEARKIMAAWPEIANALALKVEEVLGREDPETEDAPNKKESDGQ
ncbi:helicase [Mycobacterium phage Barnyard]|uniref:Uncharacterized protein n=1 Tax=Mycobacterium phage Barnyard TaxID=205880 RepID=Q856B0_9CAUD|nr:helicase [Mycobacterium phage Barnyard]AAN02116.1 hypothetical protein PBI_BARNYARD_62 [Mycobacterium phage Barnyard]